MFVSDCAIMNDAIRSQKDVGSHYEVLESASAPKNDSSGSRHIPVETWLGTLGLMEYEHIFNKFLGVENLLQLTESDIRDLGVRNHAHRARMVSTLTLYKDQINKKMQRSEVPQSMTPTEVKGSIQLCYSSQSDYAAINVSNTANVAQALLGKTRDQPAVKELAQYAWYHGNIPRIKAESLLTNDGNFLVRDSTSKPGDFVLTVRCKGSPLHFVMNKKISVSSPGSPPLIEYQFEERLYEKPKDLLLYYLENKKPITELSGAVLGQPVMRAVPLEYYDPRPSSPHPSGSPICSPWGSPRASPKGSPRLKPKLSIGVRPGSQQPARLEGSLGAGHNSSVPALDQHLSGLDLNAASSQYSSQPPGQIQNRAGSEPTLSSRIKPNEENQSSDSPVKNAPPKPSRIPTLKKRSIERPFVQIRNTNLYDDDGGDYSDYDQIKSWPCQLNRSTDLPTEHLLRNSTKPGTASSYDVPKSAIRNAQIMYDIPKSVREVISSETQRPITLPDINASSNFDLIKYDSEILTPNNKPLEPSAVSTIRSLLLDSGSDLLAQHLTYLDLKLLQVQAGDHDLGLGVTSGLELITLPQGHRLRQDLIDRYECLCLFVALTILMCSQHMDRTQMLRQWIQIAQEMRGKNGNMFSFSAIMDGIGLPQIMRLNKTWLLLKQQFSESAFIYEHRLLGLLSALDNASATLPLQNITVPHVMPLVRLLERDFLDVNTLLPWESRPADYGVDMMLAHLDTARIVTQQCQLYSNTASIVLQDFVPRRDIQDLFKTEMHQKLLWGARGAGVNLSERLSKFPAVLDLLSHRVEPNDDEGQ